MDKIEPSLRPFFVHTRAPLTPSSYHSPLRLRFAPQDYATRFSGITEEILRDVDTTLEQAQVALLGMLDAETVVVGHSLENDLAALKLAHGESHSFIRWRVTAPFCWALTPLPSFARDR